MVPEGVCNASQAPSVSGRGLLPLASPIVPEIILSDTIK